MCGIIGDYNGCQAGVGELFPEPGRDVHPALGVDGVLEPSAEDHVGRLTHLSPQLPTSGHSIERFRPVKHFYGKFEQISAIKTRSTTAGGEFRREKG